MAAGDLGRAERPAPRWDLLEAEPPASERLAVRSALGGGHADVLIGVDAALGRYVLVRIPPGEEDALAERVSRGIEVRTVKMVPQDTGEEESFIEIACLDPQGHRALDVVVGELVESVERSVGGTRVKLVQGVLARWRRFWSGVFSEALSVDQQVGLFGELFFLGRWLCEAVGPSRAVSAWRGPNGARNDFELPGFGIEVKATKRVDAVHIIHGLDQLLEPTGGTLLLFGLSVRDEASASESLPRLVRELRARLASGPDALNRFEALLYAAGYDDRLEAEYAKLMLRVRTEALYRVSGDFPRLVPESIPLGLPPGVGGVSYELSLEAAVPWRVASSSRAAVKLLRDFSSSTEI